MIDPTGILRKIYEEQHELYIEAFHESILFPEDTDETVTFTAGGANNTFGAWVEIVDNTPVTLSSKFTTEDGHISSILLLDANINDKVYIIELAYGAAKTIITPYSFVSGTVLLPPTQQVRVRAVMIPAGELVYYRMKCETGAATCRVSFRYHYH